MPAPGEAVVDVERVGVCGTDVEFFTGEMAYLHQGHAWLPMRLGHEWAGRVSAVGDGVDPAWVGRRVMGDTMLGDGVCRRCRNGHQHTCENRQEVGVRGGRAGALAEQLAVPVSLPACAARHGRCCARSIGRAGRQCAARGAGGRGGAGGPGPRPRAGHHRCAGGHVPAGGGCRGPSDGAGRRAHWTSPEPSDSSTPGPRRVCLACRSMRSSTRRTPRSYPPSRSIWSSRPAGWCTSDWPARPSAVDTRRLVLSDVTAVGILSASPGLEATIAAYASGAVDPRPLVAATVGLDDVGDVLAGQRPPGSGPGPKFHVDPRPGRKGTDQ